MFQEIKPANPWHNRNTHRRCIALNTRTNIVLDDKLVALAMKRAGVTTKKAAVEAALKAFVIKRPKIDYEALLALEGSGLIADDYDPREPYGLRAGSPARIAAEVLAQYEAAQQAERKPVPRSKRQP